MSKSTAPVATPQSNHHQLVQQANATTRQGVSATDQTRINQILADSAAYAATAVKSSLSIALLLLTLSTQALASNPTSTSQNLRQGLPSCLNQPDKNGPRPGCG